MPAIDFPAPLKFEEPPRYLQGAQESLKNILQSNPILPSATFVKREALLEVGLFDPRIVFEDDRDLWLRLHENLD